MSTNTAVLDPVEPAVTAAESVIGPPIPVAITFAADLTYTVDKSFIRVPENTTQTIVWTINGDALPKDIRIGFDTPAVTVLGAGPVDRIDPQKAELAWTNKPLEKGLSFYYRIHMFGVKLDDTGNIVEYFAVNHDPTIHNDPPSAP
jgi:hypothetical protein